MSGMTMSVTTALHRTFAGFGELQRLLRVGGSNIV